MDKSKKAKVSATEHSTIGNTVVIGVDGSIGSQNAVELVVEDFHRKGLDKIYVVHISDAEKEKHKGVAFHSKNIYNHHHEYLKKHLPEKDFEVHFEERKGDNVFEQMNDFATSKQANLLVLGFRGYNGNKNRPDELSKGIKFLVHKPLIPCLVVKEKLHREYRVNNGFRWLVCLESAESKSFKAFQSVLRYIDAESDILHGFTVDLENGNAKKVEEAFKEHCTKNKITNVEFDIVKKDEKGIQHSIDSWIESHLQKENHFVDFIVLGYNPSKYNFNKDAENTTVCLLKNAHCNVFFDH